MAASKGTASPPARTRLRLCALGMTRRDVGKRIPSSRKPRRIGKGRPVSQTGSHKKATTLWARRLGKGIGPFARTTSCTGFSSAGSLPLGGQSCPPCFQDRSAKRSGGPWAWSPSRCSDPLGSGRKSGGGPSGCRHRSSRPIPEHYEPVATSERRRGFPPTRGRSRACGRGLSTMLRRRLVR